MEKFFTFKNKKKEIMFVVSGLILLIAVIGFIFYAIRFLVIKAGGALGEGTIKENGIPKINFDGLKKIGIMK